MDLLEIAVGFLEKGGALAGLGGGYIATRVLAKISGGLKKAEDALKKADEALTKATEALKQASEAKGELAALRFQGSARTTGGQIGNENPDLLTRVAVLERRISSIEDDLDKKSDEDRRAWEAINRAVGRIEGAINPRGR